MNPIDSLLEQIEADTFATMVNLASSYKSFVHALRSQPEVLQLAEAMPAREVQDRIRERVVELTALETDPGYEHPRDAALAAYIWLLQGANRELARSAAARIGECRACWWARKVAEQTLAEGGAPSKGDGVDSSRVSPAALTGSGQP